MMEEITFQSHITSAQPAGGRMSCITAVSARLSVVRRGDPQHPPHAKGITTNALIVRAGGINRFRLLKSNDR